MKEEGKMCKLDGFLIDDVVESFIISVGIGDTSDSDVSIDSDSASAEEVQNYVFKI